MTNSSRTPDMVERAPSTARRSRKHLWRLLCMSVAWAAVTLGCATLTHMTEVDYTPEGYGATVSFELAWDERVFHELEAVDPTLPGMIAEGAREVGWEVEPQYGGRKLVAQQSYVTLEELANSPQLLADAEDEDEEPFFQEFAVTASEVDAETVEYVYAATIVVEATSPAEQEADEETLAEMLEEYPELMAALEAAGPAQIAVQTNLPGTLVEYSLNGDTIGEVEGGNVRWTFTEDQPGVYEMRAVAHGPSRAVVEERIAETLMARPNVMLFMEVMAHDEMLVNLAAWEASELLHEVRSALGDDVDAAEYSELELMLLEAGFFAQFCDLEGVLPYCLMPTARSALPLFRRLAVQNGENEAGELLVANVIEQVVAYDLGRLMLVVDDMGASN